jgi:hypothetical protein
MTSTAGTRERGAHLPLLLRGEQVEEPIDRLGGVDRVHRGDDQMPGFRRLDGGQGRLGVADLADEHDIWILADDVAERVRIRLGVEADLALLDDREVVLVDNFDGVLDGHDVRAPGPVDVADDRGDRGGLARPRGTG